MTISAKIKKIPINNKFGILVWYRIINKVLEINL